MGPSDIQKDAPESMREEIKLDQYPQRLTKEELEYLVSTAADWSILNGLAVRPSPNFISTKIDPSRACAVPAPICLFPSIFPRNNFQRAKALQEAYNHLYCAISQDERFLSHIIEELQGVDLFISRLWKIHCEVQQHGYLQSYALGIFRSDYMVTSNDLQLKQVEFNTIASSFAGLATKTSQLHQYLSKEGVYPTASTNLINDAALPINSATDAITDSLLFADSTYKRSPLTGFAYCILFVVQEAENNIFDQLAISTRMQQNGCESKIFRVSLVEVLERTQPLDDPVTEDPDLDTKSHATPKPVPLIYSPTHSPDAQYEVTVVYFRAGYAPTEYDNELAWHSRSRLEKSYAIKCPSIACQIAGTKKVQQVLANPGSQYLEEFLGSTAFESFIPEIRASFTNIYPLDDTKIGREAVAQAFDPEKCLRYVLKPQREGGGNNIYGAKIPDFLRRLGTETDLYRGYILMEMINTTSSKNFFFRNGRVTAEDTFAELGIYGTCLWKAPKGDSFTPKDILHNQEAGSLLRTKSRLSEEGGVAAGFGCVDSPCLVDNAIFKQFTA